jgi:hypothetical protein
MRKIYLIKESREVKNLRINLPPIVPLSFFSPYANRAKIKELKIKTPSM